MTQDCWHQLGAGLGKTGLFSLRVLIMRNWVAGMDLVWDQFTQHRVLASIRGWVM